MAEEEGAEDSKSSARSNPAGQGQRAASGNEDAVTLLKNDHRAVEHLFDQYEKSERRAEKGRLAQQICQELIIHTMLEEEIFYPACRDHMDDDPLDEAQVEHDSAKLLIDELLSGSPEQAFYDAKVRVLSEQIRHHVAEEERRSDGIFAKAKAGGLDMEELGQRLQQRKQELKSLAERGALERPQTRSLNNQPRWKPEESMPGYRDRYEDDERRYSRSRGIDRERDEYGRFMSEDDDRGYRSRGRSFEPERDEYGRFVSDEERGERRYQAARGGGRRRYAEDDGRGRGGWFGDPRGHSEASRLGWERSEHEGSGWYGDPRGHAEASRLGWERSEHEGSGWYGDPEGHSEASRLGWERREDYRGRSRYADERRMRGRSEYEEDRRRGGRGHGGWFGDPEGHSEAARRGWEGR